jgi:hypothetical protein
MDKFLFVDLKVDTCLFIKGLGHPFVGHFGPPKYGISVLPYVLKGLKFPIRFGIILHEKVQDVINVDPRIFQIKFVVLEVDFCPVIYIVLSHLLNSNFVVLRAVLLPKLCNPQLPTPVVLAALVVHTSPYSVMQGIFVVFANI